MRHRVPEGKTTVRNEAQCLVQLAKMARSRSCVRAPHGPSFAGDGRGVVGGSIEASDDAMEGNGASVADVGEGNGEDDGEVESVGNGSMEVKEGP